MKNFSLCKLSHLENLNFPNERCRRFSTEMEENCRSGELNFIVHTMQEKEEELR